MSHSKGYDGISTLHLKLINKDISKCLTLIISQSLNSGIFPDKLKIAKVTPIYKKGVQKLNFLFIFLNIFENNFYMVTRELPMEKYTIFYLYAT